MVGEPSTSSAENENSLTELFVNSLSEENNENEFPLSPLSSGPSCRSTPSLERKSEFVYLLFFKKEEILYETKGSNKIIIIY